MEINYSTGFELSVISSIFLSVPIFIYLRKYLYNLLGGLFYLESLNQEKSSSLEVKFLRFFLIPSLIGAVFVYINLSLFPFFYSLLNIILQKQLLNKDFYVQEIANGVISLRISGIFILLNLLVSLRNVLKFKNYEDVLWDLSEDGEKNFQRFWIEWLIIIQNLFYSGILTFLLIFKIFCPITLEAQIISFILLFIIDDWFIIADNLRLHLEIESFSHSIRIYLTDLILLIILVILCYKNSTITIIFYKYSLDISSFLLIGLTVMVGMGCTVSVGEFLKIKNRNISTET